MAKNKKAMVLTLEDAKEVVSSAEEKSAEDKVKVELKKEEAEDKVVVTDTKSELERVNKEILDHCLDMKAKGIDYRKDKRLTDLYNDKRRLEAICNE